MALSASFGDLTGLTKFAEVFFNRYEEIPSQYPSICKEVSTDKKQEAYTGITGLTAVPVKNENEDMETDDPIQGYDKTITNVSYGLGVEISRELMDYDQYGTMKKISEELAASAKRTVEQLVANIYNNAFTSGTVADGQYLCYTGHTRLDGGTAQANRPATGVDLDIAALETGRVAMRRFKGHRGQVLYVRPTDLLIPPDLEKTAEEILGSDKDPENLNNAVNFYKGKMKAVVNDYLSDTDAWFILDRSKMETILQWNLKPEFESDNLVKSKNLLWSVYFRCVAAVMDWPFIYGSPGIG